MFLHLSPANHPKPEAVGGGTGSVGRRGAGGVTSTPVGAVVRPVVADFASDREKQEDDRMVILKLFVYI